MQVISGPGNASNILLTAQKRLLRPSYAQTQATPYASYLDPSLRNSYGTVVPPVTSGVAGGITYTANTFTYEGSIVPSTVMARVQGTENVVPHNGATTVQPWGLLDQWVGGTFDNIGQLSEVSVWMGPDSTYELLAPAWNDTGLAAALTDAAGADVLLYAGADGRLSLSVAEGGTAANGSVAVARVIQRWSAAHITIQLVI